MSYGKGLRRCPPEKVAHRTRLGAKAAIKGSAQLTPCRRLDQGQTGTCHTHSLVAAVWCALNAAGHTPAFVGSPRTLASCVYAAEQRPNPGATLVLLKDTGADLQDDATALATWGLAPIQDPTSDGRFSDCENDPPDNTFPEANLLRLEKVERLTGEYSVAVDSSAPRTVAGCLDAGIPVQVGVFVDTAFENLGALDIAQPADQQDPNGGGHALYISGYRTATSGQLEFRVENSWGSGWCDQGACWASEAWLLTCWELFPLAVHEVIQTLV